MNNIKWEIRHMEGTPPYTKDSYSLFLTSGEIELQELINYGDEPNLVKVEEVLKQKMLKHLEKAREEKAITAAEIAAKKAEEKAEQKAKRQARKDAWRLLEDYAVHNLSPKNQIPNSQNTKLAAAARKLRSGWLYNRKVFFMISGGGSLVRFYHKDSEHLPKFANKR